MNSENFNKLFNEKHNEAMMSLFSKVEQSTFKEKSKEEKREIIERTQQTISPELDKAIHQFITAKKATTNGKQLRQMVKKRFGITVV